jgi:uncharacterized protein YndB with AHSA1/START domain
MTTTVRHNDTRISADPKLPVIEIVREFEAPPDRVHRAFTDPDLVVQWLGPRRLKMRIDHYDPRFGGSYRYVHVDTDGTEYGFHGVFHEVRPDRIVQTFTFEGVPDQVSLETATFEDLGGRTRVSMRSILDSFEARDAMIASGMEVGVREGFERLDELLASDEER